MKRIRNDERGMFFRHDIAFGYLNGPKLRNCYRAVNVSCGPLGRRTLEHFNDGIDGGQKIVLTQGASGPCI